MGTIPPDESQVVDYRRAEREQVFAFLREVFSAVDSERLIRQWNWKYETNPFNPDAEPRIMLLKQGGRPVGMYGRLFYRVVIDGTEHLAHHGCDLVVHPAYRGHGLSARLRDRDLVDSAIHFSWQNEASYRVARRDGTAGVPHVPLVKPLDAGHVIRRWVGNHWVGRSAGTVVDGAMRHWPSFRRRTGRPEGAVTTQIASFDERFDRLWQRACRDYRVMIVRDRRYLQWRFAQRPDADYRIVIATRGSEVVGYMVTRCADRGEERWGYLVDFLVQERSPSLFAELVEQAVEGLRQEGATAVICPIAVSPYRWMLYRHGFVRWPGAPRGYIRVRMRLPASQVPGGVHQWFLTMGDGDLEMSF